MEEDTAKITAAVKALADELGQRAEDDTLDAAVKRVAGEQGVSLQLVYDLLFDELTEREECDAEVTR